jgi:hypothetical protein
VAQEENVMSFKVSISIEGVQETISRLNQIEEKAQQNLVSIAGQISDEGKTAWKEATPQGKTGRLRGEENAMHAGLSVSFTSPTKYYPFVDEGHNTPAGWRRPWGFQPAKKRSFVKGREMTKKLTEWLRQNMPQYLSKFLDNV